MGGRGATSAKPVARGGVIDHASMTINDPEYGKIEAKLFTITAERNSGQITIIAAPNSLGGHEAFGKKGMENAHNLQPGKVRSYEISNDRVRSELSKRGLEDRDVLGFVHMTESGAKKGVMNPGFVIVHPAFQRQGIASTMYDAAKTAFPKGATLGKGMQRPAGKSFRKKYDNRGR